MGTPIGRILLIPRGDYSNLVTYNSLDWVRHLGAAWVCKSDNTVGVTPSASAPEWQLLSQDGSVGGWAGLANKPFNTIGDGLDVDTSDPNKPLNVDVGDGVKIDASGKVAVDYDSGLKIAAGKLDVNILANYIGSSDRPASGQTIADAIDQTYDKTSAKAQSGTAVAGALSETVNKVARTLSSVAVGAEIRIPETGTDSKLSTANTADKLIIAYSDKGDYPIISNTLSDGYTIIKVAKAETNITLGVAIIKL